MTKREKMVTGLVGLGLLFLYIQHRRAVAGAAPPPTALPGLAPPVQLTSA